MLAALKLSGFSKEEIRKIINFFHGLGYKKARRSDKYYDLDNPVNTYLYINAGDESMFGFRCFTSGWIEILDMKSLIQAMSANSYFKKKDLKELTETTYPIGF